MKMELNRQRNIKYFILFLIAIYILNYFREEIQNYTHKSLPETSIITTEVEEEFEEIGDNFEKVDEQVQLFEEKAPQILQIDESNNIEKLHTTTHQDFDGWINTLNNKKEKQVVIERFGTPELLSLFFENKLMKIMLYKKQLIH